MECPIDTIEIWKVIPFAPAYAVSTLGRLRRLVGGSGAQVRILRLGGLDRYGYRKAKVFIAGRRVHTTIHRLVALAFLGPPPSPLHQVAHGDGVRLNNHPSNLRWALPLENAADTVEHGSLRGARNPAAKLSPAKARAIREARDRGEAVRVLMAEYKIGRSQVYRIGWGHSWKSA